MISLSASFTKQNLSYLFFAALLIRSCVFFFYVQHHERYKQPDTMDYHNCALFIARGSGMHRVDNHKPIFWRTPGYPLYLTTFYQWFGLTSPKFESNKPAQLAALWLQIIISSFIPIVLLLLAYILTQSRTISWITGWISVIHLGLVLASTYLLTEGLGLIFFFLFLLFFYKGFNAHRLWQMGYAALCLATFTWIRPMGEFVVMLSAILLLLLSKTSWSVRIKKSIFLVAIFFTAIFPWYHRNYKLTGKWFFCPIVGTYINTFTVPKVLRAVQNKKLADCINAQYKKSETLSNKEQEMLPPGLHAVKSHASMQVAWPIIKRYPWHTAYEWMKEVFKTAFDTYGYQLVAFAKNKFKYDPIEEFLTLKIKDVLYGQSMHPFMRLLCWLDFLFHLLVIVGLFGGFWVFFIRPLFNRTAALPAMQHLWLKTVPIIGLVIGMTGGFGYARLRLPVEPLMIILALSFWLYKKKELDDKKPVRSLAQ